MFKVFLISIGCFENNYRIFVLSIMTYTFKLLHIMELFKEISGEQNSGYYYATIIETIPNSPYLLIKEWQESAEDCINRYAEKEITEKQAQRFFNR